MNDSIFIKNIQEYITVIESLYSLNSSVEQVTKVACEILKGGGKILLCGNGGSAADCQHIASELTGRVINDRQPLPAIALTTDTSALTCIGNDYSFHEVFARQVAALINQNDLLICISTSGNSSNLVRAAEEAHKKGALTVGLLGRDGGLLKNICDLNIVVPSSVTARIQEAHILIGHTICGLIERDLGLV